MKTILTLSLSLSLFSPLGALVAFALDGPPPSPAAPLAPAAPPAPFAPSAVPPAPPAAPSNPIAAERRAELMQNQPEVLKKYDKNGNGRLDQDELVVMKKDRETELLKKYDKNSNGKLDEDERAAYRADMKKQQEEMLDKRQVELGKPTLKLVAPKELKK